MSWLDVLGARLGPEPKDIQAEAKAAMVDEFNALNPLQQANVGMVGSLKGIGSGILDVTGAGSVSGLANRAVDQFETTDRPAIDATRAGGMGFQTVGEVLPGLAAKGGPFWQAAVAGGEAALQAPAGQRVDMGMRALGEAWALGKAVDLGAQAIGKGRAGVGALRGASAETRITQQAPVTSIKQIMGGSPVPVLSPAQRTAAVAGDLEGQLPAGPMGDRGRLRYLAGRADELGIQLTPGQRSGSRARRGLENAFESNPTTGGPFHDILVNNEDKYGRLAARAIGETADNLSPDVLGRATTRLGREFNAVTEELQAVMPDLNAPNTKAASDFFNRVDNAKRQELGDFRNKRVVTEASGDRVIRQVESDLPIARYADVIEAMGRGGELDARELMNIRSSLADQIHTVAQQRGTVSNGTQIRAMGDMIDAIDRLVVDSAEGVAPELAGRYATARTQWRVLQAMQQGKATDPLGEIRAKSVDSILRREYPMEYRRGGLSGNVKGRDGALQDLANFFDATAIGAGVTNDIVGNSGTATRSVIGQALNNPTQGVVNLLASLTVGPAASRTVLKLPAFAPVPATPDWITALGAQVGAQDAVMRRREGLEQ